MSASNVKLLENLLDYTVAKQKVISKNIANVGTLNYKREDLKFEDVLSQQVSSNVKTTDPKHISLNQTESGNTNLSVSKDESNENNSGYNNVDVNQEMAEMAQNSLLFKFGSKKLGAYYQSIQHVARGGR